MVGLRIKLRDVQGFEAQISGGIRRMAGAAMDLVEKDAEKLVQSVIRRITSSTDFQKLKSDPFLRGKLGFAKEALKSGGDTDADDLVKELENTKLTRSRNILSRRMVITFPSIKELQDRLVLRFTKISSRGVLPGRTQSWFDWWEFGDQGEIDSAVVFKRGGRRVGVNRKSLNKLIEDRSRGGFALQLPSLPANDASSIRPSLVVSTTYDNFARIYPARVGKLISDFAKRTNTRRFGFFSKSRVN